MHRHDSWSLCLLLKGRVCETDLFGAHNFFEGDFIARRPFTLHRNGFFEAGARYLRLGISSHVVAMLWEKHSRSILGSVDLNAQEASELTSDPFGGDILVQEISKNPPRGRYESRHDGEMEKLAEQLTDFHAGLLNLKDYAEELGISDYQLTRRFQRCFSLTPTRYRREWRLQMALEALTETGQSLAQISELFGFSDQSHFTREVTRETGLSPDRFRRRYAIF